jgi:hypothetical protein
MIQSGLVVHQKKAMILRLYASLLLIHGPSIHIRKFCINMHRLRHRALSCMMGLGEVFYLHHEDPRKLVTPLCGNFGKLSMVRA